MQGVGTERLIWGAALIAFGLIVIVLFATGIYGETATVTGWLLGLAGVVLFLSAIVQRIGYALAGDDAPIPLSPTSELMLVVKGMLAMGLADGSLDDFKLGAMARILREIMGSAVDPNIMRELAAADANGGRLVFAELARAEKRLAESSKLKIVKACYLMLAADGEFSAGEEKRIGDIVETLKLSYERAIAAMREADRVRIERRLFAAREA